MSRFFWIDTDIGGDIDDVLTLMMVPKIFTKQKLVGISTCHVNPVEKAKIASWILKKMNFNAPVHVGEGIVPTRENRNAFFEQNPHWPKRFGVPGADLENGEIEMYKYQGKAYRECDESFDSIQVQHGAVDVLIQEAHRIFDEFGEKLHIISISPPINLAAAIERDQNFSKHVKITLMGGWFEKDGLPTRLGYNTGLNPKHSQKLIDSGCEIDIVSSQFIKDNSFELTKEEFEQFASSEKTFLQEAVIEDWINWKHDDIFQTMNIADPITLLLAVQPDLVISKQSISIKLDFDTPKDFLDVSYQFIHVEKISKSNVCLITSVDTKKTKNLIKPLLGINL